MKCSITNCDTTDVAFLLWPNWEELRGLQELWTPVVFYSVNVKQKIYPVMVFDGPFESGPDVYIILKAGERKEFNLSLEFQYLQNTRGEWTDKNTDFGAYTFKLIYNDLFQLNKQAIKGRVESNEITVNYIN
ncbi:MAG: hypothetical protein WCR42_06060 [bacterium]